MDIFVRVVSKKFRTSGTVMKWFDQDHRVNQVREKYQEADRAQMLCACCAWTKFFFFFEGKSHFHLFSWTGYKYTTRKFKSHHQVVVSTGQETVQGVCKAISLYSIRWWEASRPSIVSYWTFMFSKRFDKFNKLILGPSLQSNNNANDGVSKEKARWANSK